jgi:MFS family permease
MGTLSIRYSQPLVMRFGARATLLPGLVLGVAGLALFTLSPVDGSYFLHVLPVMTLLGAGAGLAFPALMTLSMSGASPSDAGLASGLVNTTLQVGGAIGLAVLATLASAETGRLRESGESALTALNGGYHLAYLIGAGLIVAAIAVALAVLQPERKAAEKAARLTNGKPAYSEGI